MTTAQHTIILEKRRSLIWIILNLEDWWYRYQPGVCPVKVYFTDVWPKSSVGVTFVYLFQLIDSKDYYTHSSVMITIVFQLQGCPNSLFALPSWATIQLVETGVTTHFCIRLKHLFFVIIILFSKDTFSINIKLHNINFII